MVGSVATYVALLQTLYVIAVTPEGLKAPEVVTELGAIRGFRQEVLDAEIDTFLGIPFAKPPIGKRRFRRPEPIDAWTSTYDAFSLPKSCPQVSFFDHWGNEVFDFTLDKEDMMENCLFLNVWAPRNARKLAVMVWIYGGGYSMGTTSSFVYDGRYLSAFGNVIVVSVNYRVGLFGFLYLGSEDAPGNQGLLDQHLGIKWVYDHIEKFGGDKDRITIFGESAGGASTHIHALSSLPKYFKRAIMQSPPSMNRFTYTTPDKAFKINSDMVKLVGCPSEESPNVLCCLKQLNSSIIADTVVFGPFYPTFDGLFFTEDPISAYKNVHDMQFLIGSTENEGSFFIPTFLNMVMDGKPLHAKPSVDDEEMAQAMAMLTGVDTEEQRKEILDFYSHGKSGKFDLLDAIFGDSYFTCPCRHIAGNFSSIDSNSVYLYRLRQKSSAWPLPDWAGIQHASDLDLVFGHPLSSSRLYNDVDKALSRTMMTYWTNFAKTGDPNIDDEGRAADAPVWPKYKLEDKQYMSLQTDAKVLNNLNEEQCVFWEGVDSREPSEGKSAESPTEKLSDEL